jgi:hypothetical protein
MLYVGRACLGGGCHAVATDDGERWVHSMLHPNRISQHTQNINDRCARLVQLSGTCSACCRNYTAHQLLLQIAML